MLSVEQVVVDCRALFRLLIEGQYLNKGKGAHYLHHIFLVVDRCVVFCSLNVGSEVLARVVAKFLTCRLVVLRRWAFYDFMTNRKRLHLNNLLIVLLLLIDYCFVLLLFTVAAWIYQNNIVIRLWLCLLWRITISVLLTFFDICQLRIYQSFLICLHFAIIVLSCRNRGFGRTIFVSRFQF